VLSRQRSPAATARPSRRTTGERSAQRPLTAEEKKLAGACRLYLEALPEGPHAVEVAFKVGRLEYVSGDYEAAQKHLSWIALAHPEHELSEFAANLVLDMENMRGNWEGVHRWALRFPGDRRLTAHGTLVQDLKRNSERPAVGRLPSCRACSPCPAPGWRRTPTAHAPVCASAIQERCFCAAS